MAAHSSASRLIASAISDAISGTARSTMRRLRMREDMLASEWVGQRETLAYRSTISVSVREAGWPVAHVSTLARWSVRLGANENGATGHNAPSLECTAYHVWLPLSTSAASTNENKSGSYAAWANRAGNAPSTNTNSARSRAWSMSRS